MPKRPREETCSPRPTKKAKKVTRVSATKVRNYMMDDPIIDWLELYGAECGLYKRADDFKELLFEEGHRFEEKVMEGIEAGLRLPHYMPFYERVRKTVRAIRNGVEIIYQGGVENRLDGTFGIPDLLVRGEVLRGWLEHHYPLLDDHYYVVDIKHSSLACNGAGYLQNSKRFLPYKGQLIVYTLALEQMTGVASRFAFILGKNGKMGAVDLEGRDAPLLSKVAGAIEWYRDVKDNGAGWDVWNPHRIEMAPNIVNSEPSWSTVKYHLAFHQGDLSLLWQVGSAERRALWESGVRSWRNRRFRPDQLSYGLRNPSYCQLMTQCLEVNRTDIHTHLPHYMPPSKELTAFPDWKNERGVLEFYVDFEMVGQTIFMIGMGWAEGAESRSKSGLEGEGEGGWTYIHFTAETLKGERALLETWHQYLESLEGEFRLIHWTDAEPAYYRKAVQRHGLVAMELEWTDLYKHFLEVPISVHGAFNYGLKPIAKSLYESGLISVTWEENGVKDGLAATLMVKELERVRLLSGREHSLVEVPAMQKVIDYNEMDCKVLYSILTEFLRHKYM